MDWEPKFIGLVNERRLWMSALSMLEDKFEGKTPKMVTTSLENALHQAKNDAERSAIRAKMVRLREFAESFYPHYYVSCWSMNEIEKSVLWKAYTTTARAVAIQTTTEKLERALPKYVNIGAVRYIDYEQDGFPTENLYQWPMHKRSHYDDEREVRALADAKLDAAFGGDELRQNTFSNDGSATAPIRIYAPPVDLSLIIEAIYLHPAASDSFASEATRFCESAKLPTPRASALSAVGQF